MKILTSNNGSKFLKVREEDCIGCNLRSIVCLVDGAIDMIETTNKEPMTWNELQASIK